LPERKVKDSMVVEKSPFVFAVAPKIPTDALLPIFVTEVNSPSLVHVLPSEL